MAKHRPVTSYGAGGGARAPKMVCAPHDTETPVPLKTNILFLVLLSPPLKFCARTQCSDYGLVMQAAGFERNSFLFDLVKFT